MEKCMAILLATLILTGAFVLSVPVFAEEATAPDWIITEVCADSGGVAGNTNGYDESVSRDCFEFIEIYNNSGRELNLYDYAITFSKNEVGSELYEAEVQRYTPFLPGDYRDDSPLTPYMGALGDMSNMPTNPETCMVAPGEVVVLWIMYYEAYAAVFNEGKGMSMADFRAHWNIPEDVKVIAVDGNGNATNGGHPKNFNVINSGCGTYGITLISEEMDELANVKDGPGLQRAYAQLPEMVCWITLDYNNVIIGGEMSNLSINFTWDFGGYACKDQAVTDYFEQGLAYDARRGYVLSYSEQPTAGRLNAVQKMTLGVPLEQGESYTFGVATMYWPFLDEPIAGFSVNGELYEHDTTFTAPAAGLYTFDLMLKSQAEQLTAEVPTTEQETTPPEQSSELPTEQPTEAAPESTEQSTEQKEEGCGATLSLVLMPCLAFACIALIKKRR